MKIYGLEKLGISNMVAVHYNLSPAQLIEKALEKEKFDAIFGKLVAYLQNREIFIFDGRAGADLEHTRRFRIINELASQNLFIHQLLIRTNEDYNENNNIDFTPLCA